jgi:ubiquinone/menaquinone biosynthesis C-methylase UbiE
VFAGLAAASGARPGDQVLDVGCGTGIFTRVMAEAVAPDGSVHGVDPSGEAITQARRLTGVPNCTFSTGVDAPDGTYDVLVSSLMIHHLPDALRSRASARCSACSDPAARFLSRSSGHRPTGSAAA